MFARLAAWTRYALGVIVGLALLEVTLRANPSLLLRGMALPAPVDPPITVKEYGLFASDADVFYWHSDIIRTIPPEKDLLEAEVRFETDEFGFPNAAPQPETVDVVVLGRSYSLGAQAARPWVRLLEEETGLKVLNLSQAASSLDVRQSYLLRYGQPRNPRWVIIEILPSMDILGYAEPRPFLVPQLPVPILRQMARQHKGPIRTEETPAVYPLTVEVGGNEISLTFFSYYLAALTADESSVVASNQWRAFSGELAELTELVEDAGACALLLYAATKEEIYYTLASNPDQLQPAADLISPWRLSEGGDLVQDPELHANAAVMRANAQTLRQMVSSLASSMGLDLVDPFPRFLEGGLQGEDPFMSYDTHWSVAGHRWVAEQVAEILHRESCP